MSVVNDMVVKYLEDEGVSIDEAIRDLKNIEPEVCCSGSMCGCYGMPTNPEYYILKELENNRELYE